MRKLKFGYEDVWTFTAICADTKLVPAWFLRNRDIESATIFLKDLASNLSDRIQLTTNGHKMYLDAVERAFGADIDFSRTAEPDNENEYAQIYSTDQCFF
jgi:transposase-like protein